MQRCPTHGTPIPDHPCAGCRAALGEGAPASDAGKAPASDAPRQGGAAKPPQRRLESRRRRSNRRLASKRGSSRRGIPTEVIAVSVGVVGVAILLVLGGKLLEDPESPRVQKPAQRPVEVEQRRARRSEPVAPRSPEPEPAEQTIREAETIESVMLAKQTEAARDVVRRPRGEESSRRPQEELASEDRRRVEQPADEAAQAAAAEPVAEPNVEPEAGLAVPPPAAIPVDEAALREQAEREEAQAKRASEIAAIEKAVRKRSELWFASRSERKLACKTCNGALEVMCRECKGRGRRKIVVSGPLRGLGSDTVVCERCRGNGKLRCRCVGGYDSTGMKRAFYDFVHRSARKGWDTRAFSLSVVSAELLEQEVGGAVMIRSAEITDISVLRDRVRLTARCRWAPAAWDEQRPPGSSAGAGNTLVVDWIRIGRRFYLALEGGTPAEVLLEDQSDAAR